jgi:hypothetical protein
MSIGSKTFSPRSAALASWRRARRGEMLTASTAPLTVVTRVTIAYILVESNPKGIRPLRRTLVTATVFD